MNTTRQSQTHTDAKGAAFRAQHSVFAVTYGNLWDAKSAQWSNRLVWRLTTDLTPVSA